jgi:hypothetical protein
MALEKERLYILLKRRDSTTLLLSVTTQELSLLVPTNALF